MIVFAERARRSGTCLTAAVQAEGQGLEDLGFFQKSIIIIIIDGSHVQWSALDLPSDNATVLDLPPPAAVHLTAIDERERVSCSVAHSSHPRL